MKKYLNPALNVIELGGSIGVVSSHIVAQLKPSVKLISVEANNRLLKLLQINLSRYSQYKANYQILNYAINYTSEFVYLNLSGKNTSTTTKVVEENTGVSVKSKTIKSIVSELQLGQYALVCDIEGSEIDFILNEDCVLDNCLQLIIELHNTIYMNVNYSINDMINLIQSKHKFKLIEQSGHVFYFTK